MPLYALGDSRPSLEPGQCWVAPNAVLVGQVHLKKDASLWFGAMVRADNELVKNIPLSIAPRPGWK